MKINTPLDGDTKRVDTRPCWCRLADKRSNSILPCPARVVGDRAGYPTGGFLMTPFDFHLSMSLPSLSRRTLVGSSLAAAAVWRLGAPPVLGAWQEASDPTTWRTWLLESVDELRPAAPPKPASTEIDELIDYQGRRSDETAAIVTKWGSRPAVIPWVELGLELADEFGLSGPRTVGSSFPSLHAAVAGAASTVLTYLFPDAEPGRFDALAEEAATSRLWAGANYPSDAEAGLALGQAEIGRA